MERENISSGTPGEAEAAFSRAVRIGNFVFISGTTASDTEGQVQYPGDVKRQAQYVLDKISIALKEAGAKISDVVRTRIYLRNVSDSNVVAQAHKKFFGTTRPANTLVHVEPIDPGMLVEIEADAIINTE